MGLQYDRAGQGFTFLRGFKYIADVTQQVQQFGKVVKVDEDQRLVYGWASVIEENGEPVVDSQDDLIREPVLQKAAHQFILEYRAGKLMHQGKAVGSVVESMVFTKSLQQALGVNLNKIGWLIAYKVEDDALWARVKAGEFPAFSIGGHGRRVNA